MMIWYRDTDRIIDQTLVEQVLAKYKAAFGGDDYEYVGSVDLRDRDQADCRVGMMAFTYFDELSPSEVKEKVREIATEVGIDPPVEIWEMDNRDEFGRQGFCWVQPINEVSLRESVWVS